MSKTRTFSSSLVALLGLAAFSLPGCVALSKSSMALASLQSAMSSLQSSSDMMGASAPYQDDVSSLARAVVEEGADASQLLARLGPVAKQHGVTDWEAEPLTYYAVGAGLHQGGLDPEQARAFARDLVGDDEKSLQALVLGYGS